MMFELLGAILVICTCAAFVEEEVKNDKELKELKRIADMKKANRERFNIDIK